MHHGGRLIHKYYLDGSVTYFEYVDKDKMSLTEIDCMVVYLGHLGRIDYWYRVEDEGHLKRVEFDSEVIGMCENVPQVRMINMYMDHRDNLNDVLNSQTGSNVYCRYSSQVYHYADDVRTPSIILQELPQFDKAIVLHDWLGKATSNEVNRTRKPTPSMNSATGKGKEKVVAVDEGCVQHEPIKGNSKGKEKVAEVDEGYVQHETNIANSKGKEKVAEVDEGCVQQKTTKATSKGKEKVAEVDEGFVDAQIKEHLRKAPQSDEESIGHRFLEFNTSCDMGIVEFEVGMQFADSSSFRNALKASSIKQGWEICWMKSEKYRIRAICAVANYPFEIYVSKMQHDDTLQGMGKQRDKIFLVGSNVCRGGEDKPHCTSGVLQGNNAEEY
ncbi:hypothetical protein Pyn_23881 [Prunus yedoensis var. nudiflora]|uniref:Uncharacterized protein n=1 Tax=Prunus yedoensis var. nudiflora TaxID=2094558 RepID=A0A314YDD5_PRUYE|nr:hypothetical protein Pyn_23881 [Prunus yedoensis var. nudiflora]